jgi:hypothetical protein
MLRILKRVWLPLLIVVVVTVGGLAAYRIRGLFGAEKPSSAADSSSKDAKPFNPKVLQYQVYGAPGSVADVNYFDEDAQPTRVDGVQLPWSFTIVSTLPSLTGNIVAQGNGGQIGCRIIVNGELKMERSSSERDAYTYCIVKSA